LIWAICVSLAGERISVKGCRAGGDQLSVMLMYSGASGFQ
jgi:hypothetical protein